MLEKEELFFPLAPACPLYTLSRNVPQNEQLFPSLAENPAKDAFLEMCFVYSAQIHKKKP
jgi:hypothetical protein